MYGYIDADGIVGEVFDKAPPRDQYHESYYERIVKLPKNAGAGWKQIGKRWLDPLEAGQEDAEAKVRSQRDCLLDRCDLIYCNASNWELTDDCEKAAWLVYKQALRDVTEQTGFPYNVVWPKSPKDGETA